MEVATIALILIVIGLVCILAEAVYPGAFFVIPGIITLVIGIIGYAVPDFLTSIYMPILVIVLFVILSIVTVKFYHWLARPKPPETTITSNLVGKKGLVTAPTEKDSLKGKVKIDNDVWSANSDEPIEAGTEVEVIGAEGVHIKVKKIQ